MAEPRRAPRYSISSAATLTGLHPQTLRYYDKLGLVVPLRTAGGGRRYSEHDLERLLEVQRLSRLGVSLEGVLRIFLLERRVEVLERENAALRRRLRVLP